MQLAVLFHSINILLAWSDRMCYFDKMKALLQIQRHRYTRRQLYTLIYKLVGARGRKSERLYFPKQY